MTGRHIGPEPADVARVHGILAQVRRRWFLTVWLRVATEVLLVAAVATLAAWMVSRLTAPAGAGLLLLAAAVIGVTGAALFYRARPIWHRPDDRQVARYVEEHVGELDEAFVSAVGCLGRPTASSLAPLLFSDVAARLGDLDLDRVVPRSALRRQSFELAAGGALLLAALVVARDPALQTWDLARMAIAPPVLTVEVVPGDTEVREGDAVRMRARVVGLPARVPREALTVSLDRDGRTLTIPMAARDDWQEVVLEDERSSFVYRVSGHGVTSPTYRVDVRPQPRVSRIDVHYEFPAFSGLAARIDEDSGDIYAPAGTTVRWVVHTTVPVPRANLGLASGERIALEASAPQILEGQMIVSKDDAYRLTLLEADGHQTRDDTEYFVRTMDDRPPDVRIVKPAGDRRVTRLEEVVIEAQADDDFGIDRFELVYAARGGEEHVVRLGDAGGTNVKGRHTLFIEDLDVQPGDFVSYYARARDIGRGKRPTESQSDIFFLEVRPFGEEFAAVQSSAQAGGGGGGLDDLAGRQKELIIATWKLERRSVAGRSRDDILALAAAQGELKATAEQLADRMSPRRTRLQVGQPDAADDTGDGPNPLRRAVEAMGRSQQALEALQTARAVPHEMDALNQLLRAQAEIQRRQVAQQQSAGGQGSSGNEDLSALFDRELQRQQQTKYENRSSVEEAQRDEASKALDRLRELARRQDELSRRQQELARRQSQLAEEERKRQLERLTREQEELRRQAEQLAAELAEQRGQSQSADDPSGQSGGGGSPSEGEGEGEGEGKGKGKGKSNGEALQAAAEAMERSSGGLGRDDLGKAASEAQRAAERLREAERALSGRQGQDDETARAAGDLQLEAAQLAEDERRIARQLRQESRLGADQMRQLAGQQDAAASQAARLRERAGAMGQADQNQSPGGQPGSGPEESVRSLAGDQFESQLRQSARALREGAQRADGGSSSLARDEADRAERLARALEGAARALGRGAGPDQREALSEQLARAAELRERLEALTRTLQQGGREQGAADQQGGAAEQGGGDQQARSAQQGQGKQGAEPGTSAGAGGQSGAAAASSSPSGSAGRNSSPDGRAGSGQGGGTADGVPASDDVTRELRALERLAEGLGDEGEGLRQALSTLQGYAASRSAPGTEGWKQDFDRWDALRRQVVESLEQLETRVSEQLQAQEHQDRLDAGASDAAPDAYRREVEQYYRSLARKPPS